MLLLFHLMLVCLGAYQTSSQSTTGSNSADCQFTLTATKFGQYIRSPNWPNPTPSGLNCTWYIRGPSGSQINTYLDSFHTDPSNSLSFIENGMIRRTVSGLYTIWNHPRLRNYTTTGSELTLNFLTPSSFYTSLGFQLVFKAVGDYVEVMTAGCPDWSYKATSVPQHIRSPNYPINYPDDLRETYYICGPEGSQIFVQLIRFDTERCCDFLQYIINGSQVQSISGVNRVRGSPRLQNYTSPGSNLTLRFITNFIGSAWGFDLTYQAIGDFEDPVVNETISTSSVPTTTDQPAPARCGDQLIATSTPQTISSPGSPSYYPRDLGCSWYINSPPGTQIFLEFSSFDLDSYDYFTINEGRRRLRQMRGRNVLRNNPSYRTYTSPGSSLILSFVTDSIGASFGFDLTYQVIGTPSTVAATTTQLETTSPALATSTSDSSDMAVGSPDCGSYLTATNIPQNISSPGWPNNYPNNLNCSWTISCPDGYGVVISFDSFRTETTWDYLTIYENEEEQRKMDGLIPSSSYTSFTSDIVLTFITSQYKSYPGFHATYLRRVLTPEEISYP